jgi:UDP-GlcNAc:undecaprenyl-phosphate/decaprenyl-phosphate GlcNAc-1-phosphate transferase
MLSTELYLLFLAFTLGVFISMMSIPPILDVAREKKLFDTFNARKLHHKTIPRLGGVAIFLGFVMSTIICTDEFDFEACNCIIASVILLFFIGLLDDVIPISAGKKFVVQVVAVTIVALLGEVSITNLHGIFGWHEISRTSGLLVTLFIMLTMINAFNLIDGIDGLAAGLAMLASTFFGTWFFLAGYYEYAILSMALTGSLGGFFLFNVFGNRNKLFMGDNGSLVIGLLVAIQAVQFNEFSLYGGFTFGEVSAPPVSLAVVAIPMTDTLRVMIIRILHHKSPFSPDNIHIHHRLLLLFPGHLTVTLIIVTANMAIIGLAILFSTLQMAIVAQFMLVFLVSFVMLLIPALLLHPTKRHRQAMDVPLKV